MKTYALLLTLTVLIIFTGCQTAPMTAKTTMTDSGSIKEFELKKLELRMRRDVGVARATQRATYTPAYGGGYYYYGGYAPAPYYSTGGGGGFQLSPMGTVEYRGW